MSEQNSSLVIVSQQEQAIQHAARIADQHAAAGTFSNYLIRKAANTRRIQGDNLATFARYLNQIGLGEPMRLFAETVANWNDDPTGPDRTAQAWKHITHGLVAGFVRWLESEGFAVGTINLKLSTVKTYSRLAYKAGIMPLENVAQIRAVDGYAHKEATRLDEARQDQGTPTRVSTKKAKSTELKPGQGRKLKNQPANTPIGRRDRLIMCLLLDHGLRVGEMARLTVGGFDLAAGTVTFHRPKVDKVQTEKLSPDALRAARAYFDAGDAPLMADEPVLRNARKGGELTQPGMSEWAISQRVRYLGEQIEVENLSAHDCRHYWATITVKKVDISKLQDMGGWNSPAMPMRYVQWAKIANEGVTYESELEETT